MKGLNWVGYKTKQVGSWVRVMHSDGTKVEHMASFRTQANADLFINAHIRLRP